MSKISTDIVNESTKSVILRNEPHAISLANYTVAYSRKGEEEDTLIIRELSNRSSFDHFGVKGVVELERLFYSILGLLNSHLEVLAKRARFGEGWCIFQINKTIIFTHILKLSFQIAYQTKQ